MARNQNFNPESLGEVAGPLVTAPLSQTFVKSKLDPQVEEQKLELAIATAAVQKAIILHGQFRGNWWTAAKLAKELKIKEETRVTELLGVFKQLELIDEWAEQSKYRFKFNIKHQLIYIRSEQAKYKAILRQLEDAEKEVLIKIEAEDNARTEVPTGEAEVAGPVSRDGKEQE